MDIRNAFIRKNYIDHGVPFWGTKKAVNFAACRDSEPESILVPATPGQPPPSKIQLEMNFLLNSSVTGTFSRFLKRDYYFLISFDLTR